LERPIIFFVASNSINVDQLFPPEIGGHYSYYTVKDTDQLLMRGGEKRISKQPKAVPY
jgi:hypothetical protein